MKLWIWKWMLRPALVLALMLLVARGIGYWFSPFNRRSFDQQAWLSGDSDLRASMSRSTISKIPKGMDESAILPLLGPPSYIVPWEVQWQNGFVKGSHYYSYNLGSWPIAAFDATYLWIHIDGNGKVICAEIGGF